MGDFQPYKSTVTTVGGNVYISLPDDQYIEMPPEKARALASHLFVKANEAEGKPAPELIIMSKDLAT